MCSSPTFVSSTTACEHVRRVVAAAEPRFDDCDVDSRSGERGERRGGQRLELRRPDALGRRAARVRRPRSKSASSPSTRIRSLQPRRGARDRRADRRPSASRSCSIVTRRRRLAVRADDVDRRDTRLRIAELGEQRPHPLEPEAVRAATGSGSRASDAELTAVSRRARRARAGSARASRARPRRRRPARSPRSARSRACPRRARSPCAAARARPRGCRRRVPLRADDRREDRRSSSASSSTRTPLRRKSCAASCTRSSASTSPAKRASASGHGETISRDVARRQVRPDLLGDVRHHRMEEREQPLERGERGRAARPRRRRRAAA